MRDVTLTLTRIQCERLATVLDEHLIREEKRLTEENTREEEWTKHEEMKFLREKVCFGLLGHQL